MAISQHVDQWARQQTSKLASSAQRGRIPKDITTRPPTPHNPTLRALAGFFIAAVLPNARPVVERAAGSIKFREETFQPSSPLSNPPKEDEKTPRTTSSVAPPLMILRHSQGPECHG
jgi:hypothetical protein